MSTCAHEVQSQDYSDLLQQILNDDHLKKYFHPKLENRNPYYLLPNKYINPEHGIFIDGIPVVMKDSSKIEGQNYIEITSFEKTNDNGELWLYYKIENISVLASFRKEKDNWDIKVKKIMQF